MWPFMLNAATPVGPATRTLSLRSRPKQWIRQRLTSPSSPTHYDAQRRGTMLQMLLHYSVGLKLLALKALRISDGGEGALGVLGAKGLTDTGE